MTDFVTDPPQLWRESPASCVVISTPTTAQFAGAVVKFGARDSVGNVFEKTFMLMPHFVDLGNRWKQIFKIGNL